jgi:DNA-binding protein HU-beta
MMANKKDVEDSLAQGVDGLSRKQAADAVDHVLNYISDCLQQGQEVRLPGFGVLAVKHRPARQGRNPTTGATIEIAARKNVRFTPAKALKDRVNS